MAMASCRCDERSALVGRLGKRIVRCLGAQVVVGDRSVGSVGEELGSARTGRR